MHSTAYACIKDSRNRANKNSKTRKLAHLYRAYIAYVLHISVGCRIKSHVLGPNLHFQNSCWSLHSAPSMHIAVTAGTACPACTEVVPVSA